MFDEISNRQRIFNEAINFASQILVGKKFSGHYAERRYVSKINNYRDLILVNNSEKQFKKDIENVIQTLQNKYNMGAPYVWLGMTCPNSIEAPNGHCLWVQFGNLPFGHYLFKIRSLSFCLNEIVINVQKITEATDRSPHKSMKAILDKSSKTSQDSDVTTPEDWNEYYLQLKESASQNLLYFFSHVLTLKNIAQLIKYSVLVAMTIILGGFEVIKFLGDFVIKLLHELSVLLKASTPMFLGVIDCFTKIIGGLFILISMMWNSGKSPPRMNNQYNDRYQYRSIKQ